MHLWDRSTLYNTDHVLVGQDYIAQCGTILHPTRQNVYLWDRVHCTIQTMCMWDMSTLHHTDYVLVGQKYTAPYRLGYVLVEQENTDFVLVGQKYTAQCNVQRD